VKSTVIEKCFAGNVSMEIVLRIFVMNSLSSSFVVEDVYEITP
jgi:hypothetical protein